MITLLMKRATLVRQQLRASLRFVSTLEYTNM